MRPAPEQEQGGGFVQRLRRLIPLASHRLRDDEEGVAQERAFLEKHGADLTRELERRVDQLTLEHPELRARVEHFARDPLPEGWDGGELPRGIAYELRPIHRELDVVGVLEEVIARRPLADAVEAALRRLEEDVMEALRRARPDDAYGDAYWSDELLEQILSHLLHLWAEWVRKRREVHG